MRRSQRMANRVASEEKLFLSNAGHVGNLDIMNQNVYKVLAASRPRKIVDNSKAMVNVCDTLYQYYIGRGEVGNCQRILYRMIDGRLKG